MIAQEAVQENKMGTMPIPRLIITMALPMILSMLVQALYNIADSIFVSWMSEDAFTAVSLVFPIQNLMIAVATGTGVGVSALLSRRLGQRDEKGVKAVAHNGILLAVASGLLFALAGLFFSRRFFETQTDIVAIIEYGTTYMRIITIGSVGVFVSIMMERLLQSTGKTFLSMIVQATGAIINIIFDPLLIFGLLGFPRLGMAGAAIATVAGQLVSMTLAIYFNLRYNHEVRFDRKALRPSLKIIREIYAVGLPSILMVSIGSIMVFGMNKILLSYTATAAAVLGAYFKLQSFIFMPVFGLCNAIVPITAYNYGARNRQRILTTIRLGVLYATSIMVAGFMLFQFFPEPLLRMFQASDEMLEIGIPALRIISISFLLAGYGITLGSVFQALGSGVLSLAVSVARQLVALLPAAYVLSQLSGLHSVWWAFPIADLISFPLATLFLIYSYRRKIRPIPDFAPEELPAEVCGALEI